jgi:hypothetical protein
VEEEGAEEDKLEPEKKDMRSREKGAGAPLVLVANTTHHNTETHVHTHCDTT